MLDMGTVKHLFDFAAEHTKFVEVREYELTPRGTRLVMVNESKASKDPIVQLIEDNIVIISPEVNRIIAPGDIWSYSASSIGVLALVVDHMGTCITLHTEDGKGIAPLEIVKESYLYKVFDAK